jgi:2-polyprenyl-3-methyl-5-hydroxy-6-metoxy-1,4-benzoquinol methylase
LNKVKLYIDGRTNLAEELLINNQLITIVENAIEADVIISQSTITNPELIHKTIYIAYEAPRSDHRKWCYSNFDNMKLVVTYNPENDKNNQIPFTVNKNVAYYPTNPDPFKPINRIDTTIRNRGVYFAGNVNENDDVTDSHGGINIAPLRLTIGKHMKQTFHDSVVVGIGWDNQTSKSKNWRVDNLNEIDDSKCDFMLALENTYYPHYLSEKIWDGFNSDRVTLYLGDSNIEQSIPLNCFIDLRPYFNEDTKQFDLVELENRIKNISQSEYDTILNNARQFRNTAKGKRTQLMLALTNKIIKFILDEYLLVGNEFSVDAYNALFLLDNQYRKHYSAMWYLPAWQHILKSLNKEDSILDLGCGCGHFSNLLHDNRFYNYTGIDFSEVGINIAKKSSPNHNFICGDLNEILYDEYKNHVIVSTETFEHLADDIKLLRKLPKCKIIFSVPNFYADGHYRIYRNTLEIKEYYKDVLDISEIRIFNGSGKNKIFVIKATII